MKSNTKTIQKDSGRSWGLNNSTHPHKGNAKLRSLGSLLAAVFLIASIGTPAWADRKTDAERLSSAVEHGGIMQHLKALQKIANRNGGNRYVGTRGDLQTRNYIASVLTRAGLNVQRLPVVFENFKETTPAILELVSPTSKFYVNGLAGSPNAQFDIMQASGNGDVTANIQAVQIMDPPGPTPSSSDSGCDPAHFSGFVAGNIALIQRGTCTFSTKVANAIDAGAVGVIIFNEGQPGRTALIGALLATPVSIPVVSAEWAVGKELYDLSLQGTVNVHMKTDAEYIHTETENIIAETKTGRPDHVVMVGAHLDSVDEGPGINDNGSGIGTLLEIAKGMQRLHIQPLNKVRFAFWGAEEEAQVGSGQYVNGLSDADAGKIALYLNADMLGSPNFVPSVYEADYDVLPPAFASPPPAPGSIEIEQVLVDYFNSVGPSPKLLFIEQRSDYRFFLLNGIPFAAITSGFDGNKTDAEAVDFGGTAGEPYDACYHKKCDNIHNVSEDSLDLMSGALVHTIMEFAKRDVIFP